MNAAILEDLQNTVRSQTGLKPAGGRSKTALAAPAGATVLHLSSLSGILEYQPSEYTFTAWAGTPLAEVDAALAEHGQYLPFDPPLVRRGATLGGTVAAGLSGSGRYRYGGVRDFLLGVRFLDGEGQLLRAGARVVKNSAGFDLPKMLVGSLGAYAALVELTFKVFPRPAAYATLRAEYPSVGQALEALVRLTAAPVDLFTLDLLPSPGRAELLVRIGGLPASFPARLQRLKGLLESAQVIEGEGEAALWEEAREFTWVPEAAALVKIPLTPRRLVELEPWLEENGALRRYAAGANLAWVAWPGEIEALDRRLAELALSGLVVLGRPGCPRLGLRNGVPFARRVKRALDPHERWLEV